MGGRIGMDTRCPECEPVVLRMHNSGRFESCSAFERIRTQGASVPLKRQVRELVVAARVQTVHVTATSSIDPFTEMVFLPSSSALSSTPSPGRWRAALSLAYAAGRGKLLASSSGFMLVL